MQIEVEVGDRVTFEGGTMVVVDCEYAIEEARGCGIEIIKIERPNWEVVEEKKELLTEEEREFLKDMTKYYENVKVEFVCDDITIKNAENKTVNIPDYPKNMKFEGVEKYKKYDLKELRIGGINNGFRRYRT